MISDFIYQAVQKNPLAMLGSFLSRQRPPASACGLSVSMHWVAGQLVPVPHGQVHPSGAAR